LAINLEGELDGDEQAAEPMPLIRLKDEYLEQEDGVRFLMADETREHSGLQGKP
jgi:hypothetical protein